MECEPKEIRCFLCRTLINLDNGNSESNTCSFCPKGSDKIYYCSEEHLSVHRGKIHQKRDTKHHAQTAKSLPENETHETREISENEAVNGVEDTLTCWPFRIETKPEIGRIMVAIRDIRAGEIILEEMPAVWGPNNKSPAVCLNCLKPALKVQTKPNDDNSENEIEDIIINTCSKCLFPICGKECKSNFLFLYLSLYHYIK